MIRFIHRFTLVHVLQHAAKKKKLTKKKKKLHNIGYIRQAGPHFPPTSSFSGRRLETLDFLQHSHLTGPENTSWCNWFVLGQKKLFGWNIYEEPVDLPLENEKSSVESFEVLRVLRYPQPLLALSLEGLLGFGGRLGAPNLREVGHLRCLEMSQAAYTKNL